MYKLLNYIFGWDYVYWSNSADQGIARVYGAQDYKVFYFRYRSTRLIDIISKPNQVTWLTCNPNKYFKEAE